MSACRIALIAEVEKGGIHPSILDLAALADRFSDKGAVEVRWLVVGHQAAQVASKLARTSGYAVTALETAIDAALTGEGVCDVLQPYLMDMQPDVIGLLHTSRAQDYAAAMAIALDAACITGVQGLAMQGGLPIFQRTVCGGKWMTDVQTDERPVVLTVLPGYFKFEGRNNEPGTVKAHRSPLPAARTRLVETRDSETEAALTQADTIVAAGRGIGAVENLGAIDRLAALFPKSAVAGSRIVCDAGWLPYHRQVGVTGATVAPKLYLACGISGAFQHLAGMSSSRFIVAINNDPYAAIFNAADVGVVEDLNTFLPLLIDALEKDGSDTDEHG